ncbi:MAG: hypothetical protein DRN78_06435 [Thermoproteota archaeon]|nr:MAG: hypothetical protein DRN78_06435 [Candidatus Korarchaeota archaeon]
MNDEAAGHRVPLFRDPLMNDYEVLRRAAEYYAMEGNLEALLRISNYSQLLVARVISRGEFNPKFISSLERNPEAAVRLYRQVRWKLNERARDLFRRLVAKAIIKITMKEGKGAVRESRFTLTSYEPGMDFDLEETLEYLLHQGKDLDAVTYEDIAGIEKKNKGQSVIIVIDSSGSMSGKKILGAATLAAIISHKVRTESYSIVGFNSEAFLIKPAGEKGDPIDIVGRILDLVPLGYTNIADGLSLAIEQGRSLKSPRYILITDGENNVGEDPRYIASKVKGLNVVCIRGFRASSGVHFCRELATISSGRYYELADLKDIPKLVEVILT